MEDYKYLGSVAVFDMGDMGRCPGRHRCGGSIMALAKKKVARTHAAPTSCHNFEDCMGTDWFSIAHFQGVRAPSIYEVRLLLAAQGGEGWDGGGFSGLLEQHLTTSWQNKTK